MIAQWPAPPGDVRARYFLFSTHVLARSGVVHAAACTTLSRTNLHDVKAAHLDALPTGSRLCRRCLTSAPRQLALDLRASSTTSGAGTASDASSRKPASTNVVYGEEGPRR